MLAIYLQGPASSYTQESFQSFTQPAFTLSLGDASGLHGLPSKSLGGHINMDVNIHDGSDQRIVGEVLPDRRIDAPQRYNGPN